MRDIFVPITSRISNWVNAGSSSRDAWIRRSLLFSVMLVLFYATFWMVPTKVFAADPTGTDTFNANPNSAVNMAWTLITGFLVWFMQLGFAFLGAGLIRSKNNVNYWTKSFMDFCIRAHRMHRGSKPASSMHANFSPLSRAARKSWRNCHLMMLPGRRQATPQR